MARSRRQSQRPSASRNRRVTSDDSRDSGGSGDNQIITDAEQLAEFLATWDGVPTIAFDTEFVSEYSYRPQLCLVQVAVGDAQVAIDPLAVGDMRPFWQRLVEPDHETIVHAGREELNFCLRATGKRPANLFDVQIAAGLVGHEYPAGYAALVNKLLGESPGKGETRTDWRRRPLTGQQIQYALADVRYLQPMRDVLAGRLEQLGRRHWLEEEMASWQADVEGTADRAPWRRVSGSANLPARRLALVRELWQWREKEAERRDCSPKRVLRDDLIVELAKRGSADPKQIRALRGMERRDFAQLVPALSEAIAAGLELPADQHPKPMRRENNSQPAMLIQFLSSALGSICRDACVARSIAATTNDLQELVAYRLCDEAKRSRRELPALKRGWRGELVGQMLDDLLAGRTAVRVADPRAEQPLVFDRLEP